MRAPALWLALVAVALAAAPAPAEERPNLLLILVDTLRADRLGAYGHDRPTSPHIDSLAARGIAFPRAYSPSPWTLPGFASALTGLYPSRHGAGVHGPLRNLAEEPPRVLSPRVETLAALLAREGYRSALFGSNPYLRLGLTRGYDRSTVKALGAPRIAALARNWLAARGGDEPWFLTVHFNDPHEPTDVADASMRRVGATTEQLDHPERAELERWGDPDGDSYLGRVDDASSPLVRERLGVKLAMYDAAIRQVDDAVGLLLDDLRRRGQLERTVVVLLSDHGEEFLEHAAEGREAGFDPRGIWGIGHGHTLFGELLRVPWILAGPGFGAAASTSRVASLVDLLPTLLPRLGVDVPEGLDGVDRVAPGAPVAPPVFAEAIAYGPDLVMVMTPALKVIAHRTGELLWAYDLVGDGQEQNPLPAGDPRLGGIRSVLGSWVARMAELAPPLPDPAELSDEMREGLRSLGYVQ